MTHTDTYLRLHLRLVHSADVNRTIDVRQTLSLEDLHRKIHELFGWHHTIPGFFDTGGFTIFTDDSDAATEIVRCFDIGSSPLPISYFYPLDHLWEIEIILQEHVTRRADEDTYLVETTHHKLTEPTLLSRGPSLTDYLVSKIESHVQTLGRSSPEHTDTVAEALELLQELHSPDDLLRFLRTLRQSDETTPFLISLLDHFRLLHESHPRREIAWQAYHLVYAILMIQPPPDDLTGPRAERFSLARAARLLRPTPQFLPEQPEPDDRPPRPGRNDPCWCGSGRKYKKCHLREDSS